MLKLLCKTAFTIALLSSASSEALSSDLLILDPDESQITVKNKNVSSEPQNKNGMTDEEAKKLLSLSSNITLTKIKIIKYDETSPTSPMDNALFHAKIFSEFTRGINGNDEQDINDKFFRLFTEKKLQNKLDKKIKKDDISYKNKNIVENKNKSIYDLLKDFLPENQSISWDQKKIHGEEHKNFAKDLSPMNSKNEENLKFDAQNILSKVKDPMVIFEQALQIGKMFRHVPSDGKQIRDENSYQGFLMAFQVFDTIIKEKIKKETSNIEIAELLYQYSQCIFHLYTDDLENNIFTEETKQKFNKIISTKTELESIRYALFALSNAYAPTGKVLSQIITLYKCMVNLKKITFDTALFSELVLNKFNVSTNLENSPFSVVLPETLFLPSITKNPQTFLSCISDGSVKEFLEEYFSNLYYVLKKEIEVIKEQNDVFSEQIESQKKDLVNFIIDRPEFDWLKNEKSKIVNKLSDRDLFTAKDPFNYIFQEIASMFGYTYLKATLKEKAHISYPEINLRQVFKDKYTNLESNYKSMIEDLTKNSFQANSMELNSLLFVKNTYQCLRENNKEIESKEKNHTSFLKKKLFEVLTIAHDKKEIYREVDGKELSIKDGTLPFSDTDFDSFLNTTYAGKKIKKK